jgi:DNA-binding GntR family transcriptional regulator
VGNWVADEVLYHCRLHPEHPVADLGPQQLDALHHHLRLVLQTAVAADADSDKFPADWLFHYRCGSCCGHRSLGTQSIDLRMHAYRVMFLLKRTCSESRNNAGVNRMLVAWIV